MLYSPCHIYDIKETEIDYIENIEKADNYFEWITYDGKQTQEYQDCKFNDLQIIDNNRPTFSNSINFEVNDITNQNGIDILATSAGYGNGKNANEYLTDKQLHQYTDITNVSMNTNILKDTEKYIVNETSYGDKSQDKDDLDIYLYFQEAQTLEKEMKEPEEINAKEKEIEQQLQSLEKKLQLLEKQQHELLKEKNMCEQSIIKNIQDKKLGKYYANIETIHEEKEEDESDEKEREQEPQDNMRNKKD